MTLDSRMDRHPDSCGRYAVRQLPAGLEVRVTFDDRSGTAKSFAGCVTL
jgi:hypothetical protein